MVTPPAFKSRCRTSRSSSRYGAFASPSMIGGSRAHFLAVSIYQQVLEILDWPFASAMATILLGVAILLAGSAAYLGREGASADAKP